MTANEEAVVAAGITLPQDQYAHKDAPTEWWWHVGTLKAADGRTFGFEVNAAMMFGNVFTQIEITDVKNDICYQKVEFLGAMPADWAQYDTTKPWFVNLGKISMKAIDADDNEASPMNMAVKASFHDQETGKACSLDMTFLQDGAPLLVWGTGCQPNVDPDGTSPITKNNYYYSLTHLDASGTITIDGETTAVTGLTWMDHEYGAFPKGYKWVFQNVQLANNVHFSNFSAGGQTPTLGQPLKSFASILINGVTTYVPTTTTPLGPVFTFQDVTYFMGFKIDIDTSEIQASMTLYTLVDNQVFVGTLPHSNVYEGIGSCEGTFNGSPVTGTAWIEQNLAPNSSSTEN